VASTHEEGYPTDGSRSSRRCSDSKGKPRPRIRASKPCKGGLIRDQPGKHGDAFPFVGDFHARKVIRPFEVDEAATARSMRATRGATARI